MVGQHCLMILLFSFTIVRFCHHLVSDDYFCEFKNLSPAYGIHFCPVVQPSGCAIAMTLMRRSPERPFCLSKYSCYSSRLYWLAKYLLILAADVEVNLGPDVGANPGSASFMSSSFTRDDQHCSQVPCITFLSLNAGSILPKLDELRAWCLASEFDVGVLLNFGCLQIFPYQR